MYTHTIYIFLLILLIYPGRDTNLIIDPETDDPVVTLLYEAKNNFERGEEDKALEIYLRVLEQEPGNYEALWNTSFIYTRKARSQSIYSSQEAIYRIAREFARVCLQIHPDKPRSHYVYAVSAAGLADNMSNTSERIQLIRDMKEYSYSAVKMDPDYAPGWHLKGVWHSKLANVSRTERLAARLLHGRLPDGASNEKAEEYLKRAISMDPDVILFKLDLAQHYQETGQSKKALPILETILEMQPVSQIDYRDMIEAKERYDELM